MDVALKALQRGGTLQLKLDVKYMWRYQDIQVIHLYYEKDGLWVLCHHLCHCHHLTLLTAKCYGTVNARVK